MNPENQEVKFYDIVDGEGNVVETAQQQAEAYAKEQGMPIVPKIIEQPEKMLTPIEIRKLRKLYVTVGHARALCGHRLDMNRQPRHRNCEQCWYAWFNNHGEIVQQLDEMHTKGEDQVIIILQGKKFLHRWRQFMSTVAHMKQEEGRNV